MNANRYPMRHNRLRALALALGLGAVAVSCANYSGEGNEFSVSGQVTNAGKQSLKAEIYDIGVTHGDAHNWFEIGHEHRLHDNCDCHGTWTGRKQYGIVLDLKGGEIEPSQVAVGSCVEFTGKIRSDNEGKYHTDRPVYDIAQLVRCD